MFKNMVEMPSLVKSSRNVVRHRLSSCDVAVVCTICSDVLTCTAFSRCCSMVVQLKIKFPPKATRASRAFFSVARNVNFVVIEHKMFMYGMLVL